MSNAIVELHWTHLNSHRGQPEWATAEARPRCDLPTPRRTCTERHESRLPRDDGRGVLHRRSEPNTRPPADSQRYLDTMWPGAPCRYGSSDFACRSSCGDRASSTFTDRSRVADPRVVRGSIRAADPTPSKAATLPRLPLAVFRTAQSKRSAGWTPCRPTIETSYGNRESNERTPSAGRPPNARL